MSAEIAVLGEADAQRLTERIRNRMRSLQESIDRLGELIAEAYTTQAWTALGYGTWDEYVSVEFGAGQFRLERDQRQELVVSLRSAGMSTRAIGSALGTSDFTVRQDEKDAGARNLAPVKGLDGKTYTQPERAQEFVCDDCGEVFPDEVWHCPGDDHHWPLGEFECKNCHAYERQLDGTVAPIVEAEIVDEAPEPPPSRAPRRALPDQFFDAAYDLSKAVDRIGRLAGDDRFIRNVEQVAAKHRSDLSRAVDVLTDVLNRMS